MKRTLLSLLAASAMTAFASAPQAEYLTRGVVAVKTSDGVFVSWRSLTTDDASMTYDIYRDGTKVNQTPISDVTNYTDPQGTESSVYEVKCLVGTTVKDSDTATTWSTPYLKVHLDRPASGSVKGGSYSFTPDDVSVGDVDGDGVYELFVKWFPTNAKDSASKGFTGPTIIDCYRLDGTKLWRIDLGHNIRSGNHYTQFMVYDFDGDGKAEMICKTAPGTIDGTGKAVLLAGDKVTDDYRQEGTSSSDKIYGHVKGGAEYLTVFNGLTGAEINTIPYKANYTITDESTWGDNYCNRADRYLAGVAYLDGQKPSCIMARGYYRCAFVWAVDFDGQQLTERWFHRSTTKNQGLWGEGAHSLSIGDVDGDGCDEIVYGAASLDHDGSLLYRTGGAHGDALHLAKMIPDREGLQVFMTHEEKDANYPFDTEMRDAKTGEIIYMKAQSGKDIGRGLAANVSPNWPGYEYWAASDASVYSQGEAIANNRPSINFRIYWDGDLLDECYDGTWVTKPQADFKGIHTLADLSQYSNAAACNGTKNTPNLQADIMGDWREEVILHDAATQSDLLIFTTTIPTSYKLPCLMQDHQYRMAIAWQNVAYNQPPHLSYCPEDRFSTAAAITLVSGSPSQALDMNAPIQNIVLKARNATGLTASELPAGLVWNYDAATATGTVSGTVTQDGEHTVTVTTTGANDGKDVTYTLKFMVIRAVAQELTQVAYYSFDNPGATVTNHIHGEATAVGTNLPTAIGGKKGNAVLFDGTNHYTQDAYDDIQLGADDFSIELWMKSADDAAYVFTKGSHTNNATTGASGHWIGLELKNGVLYFAIDDDVTKSQAYVKEAARFFNDEWHHVVLVRNASKKELLMYIDGIEVAKGTDSTGSVTDNNEPLVVGNVAVNFNNNFTGALDEFIIYKGAMNAEQVADHFAMSGIKDVLATDTAATYTVVNAMSGMLVRRAVGSDAASITNTLAQGVYILVIERAGQPAETYKFIKR